MNKKGQLQILTGGLITFITIVLVILMIFFIISTIKGTSTVCGGETTNASLSYYNGVCWRCAANTTTGNLSIYNSSDNYCHDVVSTTKYGTSLLTEYTGASYNASQQLETGSIVAPQTLSIVVIVIILSGVLGLLALVGYNVYQKMKQ